VLSNITTWNGRGGRHVDQRCPWEPDMAFTQLDQALTEWESAIPPQWKYTAQNVSATITLGTAELWSIMWMIYFQARAYLHREYVPFTPKIHYDPAEGMHALSRESDLVSPSALVIEVLSGQGLIDKCNRTLRRTNIGISVSR
jgi:hypothetical protein